MFNPVELIASNHKEIIHDISFNHQGDRFATCSSDQKIIIYEQNAQGRWQVQSELRGHDGPVWRIKWAHPQYGSIVATCSHDKTVKVYEERCSMIEETNSQGGRDLKLNREWVLKNTIIETKESVVDIKFGIRQSGIVLAIAYGDGNLLFYRADENQNLSQMLQVGSITANLNGIKCISWSKNQFEPEMIAVGGFDQDSRYRKPIEISQDTKASIARIPSFSPQVVSATNSKGQEHTLTIFGKENNTWVPLKNFDQMVHSINDVSWANSNGRSFHLLATAYSTGMKVLKFIVKGGRVELLDTMEIDQSQGMAWRVSWNMMATIIAASFEKQEIRIYKNINNRWVCQGFLREQQEKLEN